jgi:S-methylmethionine-dependent homocysteine/selenocysteine methylase
LSETSTAKSDEILILDGGMSRELVAFGAELRQPEWSALALMERPDVVERVHRAFIAAGADVVTTNSYAVVPFHIGEARFNTDGGILADTAGRRARHAVEASGRPEVRVAGSLPPLFGSYEPQKFDARRAPGLLDVLVPALAPHVDLWLGETLSLIAEAEAVCTAVARTGKPVWISFTLDDKNGGSPRLRSGETVAEAAEWLATRSPVEAMLFNCSRPEVMADAVRAARSVLDRHRPAVRIGVYANAFAPSPADGAANETLSAVRQDLGPGRYVAEAVEWVAAGATMLGGCCGIGCDHISALHGRFVRARP